MRYTGSMIMRVIIAISIWILTSAGSVAIVLAGRQVLTALLIYISTEGFQQSMRASLFDKLYILSSGITLVGTLIISERRLTMSPTWPILWIRSLRIIGIELMMLSLCLFAQKLLSTTTNSGDGFTRIYLGFAVAGIISIVSSFILKTKQKSTFD